MFDFYGMAYDCLIELLIDLGIVGCVLIINWLKKFEECPVSVMEASEIKPEIRRDDTI